MDKPIFVLLPGIKGKHLVRVDRIIHVQLSEGDSGSIRQSMICIEKIDRNGHMRSFELYSSATVDEINTILQMELTRYI